MDSQHCLYYVKRKKRYCRMTVKSGENYCGEHKPITKKDPEDLEDDDVRIVCPLDNTHTCFKNKLKKHLKKCNARPKNNLSYIQTNFNGSDISENGLEKKRSLLDHSNEDILNVIRKVNEVYEKFVECSIIPKEILHDTLKHEIENPEYGDMTRKHLIQTSALLGILNHYGLVQPDTCFVEFGAGKGKLSYWLAKSIETLPNCSILLVERASLRHKCDNKLDKNEFTVQRIRADIADLVLSKVEAVDKRKYLVGITKHLCGEATDLALKCLMNAKNDKTISGILMSFCCHHRCQWQNYVGKEFFKHVGLTKEDFDIMCGLVSWAVCGTGMSRERRNNNSILEGSNRKTELGLSLSEREIIGKKCKHIIDWGRKAYLDEQSFATFLHYYVKSDITLENVCIVAQKLK